MFQQSHEDSVPFVIVYKDKFGALKYINLFFLNYEEAIRFPNREKICEFIVVTAPEFYDFKETLISGINGEIDYWRDRQPRPVQRNIEEIICENSNRKFNFTARPPRTHFITAINQHQPLLYRPPIIFRKQKPIEDDENDGTIVTTKDGG
jgi:hypothetical protein